MSHEVLGDLFFQDRKLPAWHNIMVEGIDPTREYTAREVYELFGSPKVVTVPLQTQSVDSKGDHFPVPYRAILRGPIKGDSEPKVFGVVSDEYVLVTPQELVDLWDEHVNRRIQTMMFLREGRLMVITLKLEGFRVRGEDVETYAQIGNWMDGASASTALLSGVCTVCMNTWKMANDSALESYRFVHDSQIKHRMGSWFRDVLARAESNLPAMRDAMELLVQTKIGSTVDEARENVRTVLEAAYTLPRVPREDPLASKEWNDERLVRYEELRKTIDLRRATAMGLFLGEGTGMSLPSRKGTLWGLYQSVVEVEDYRKGARGDNLASAVLFGERAQVKDRAWSAAVAIARS